ncbi:MAG: hypothetical protein AAB450_00865 [Patescibacteria group bacterium]
MNVKIVDCSICSVKYLPRVFGKPLPGEVVCGGDTAYFEFNSSHNVVIGDDNEPCFGPGKACFLQAGDEIIAQVREVRRGHYVVTAWTHIRDWEKALEELAKPKLAKPAPAIPVPVLQVQPALAFPVPVLQVATVAAAVSAVKNQTGRDRRGIFKPTPRSTEVPVLPVSPDEASCLKAVDRLENLPPVTVEITAECSAAPAPTQTSTAEKVAKQ